MNINTIKTKQDELYKHEVIDTGVIETITDLRLFMEYHVFAVWDFMSLIKSLQNHICPSTNLWIPGPFVQDGTARLINDIVLAEESDKTMDGRSLSHFDMYLEAMDEVGADTLPVRTFLNNIITKGLESAVEELYKTHPVAVDFMGNTFGIINHGSIAGVASSFAFGRETSIPDMFQGIVDNLGLTREECPMFYYYLERHIELDGDDHGPAALKLVQKLANSDDDLKLAEGMALASIQARINFWSGVQKVIEDARPKKKRKKTTESVQAETAGILYPADSVRAYGPRF